MEDLLRSHVIEKFRIDTTSKGPDIRWFSIWPIRTGYQVLHIASHWRKYYIYIYCDKQLFIAIPIGEQAQQINVTPDYVWFYACYFTDWKSNFLAQKTILPTSHSSPRYASIDKSSGSISP